MLRHRLAVALSSRPQLRALSYNRDLGNVISGHVEARSDLQSRMKHVSLPDHATPSALFSASAADSLL
jgi:hypothetical protein